MSSWGKDLEGGTAGDYETTLLSVRRPLLAYLLATGSVDPADAKIVGNRPSKPAALAMRIL